MAKLQQYTKDHNLEIEYVELQEGQSDYIAVDDIEPPPFPSLYEPYILRAQPIIELADSMLPVRRVSKYARPRTDAELEAPKIRRNDLCPCGSGQKYKKCCIIKT